MSHPTAPSPPDGPAGSTPDARSHPPASGRPPLLIVWWSATGAAAQLAQAAADAARDAVSDPARPGEPALPVRSLRCDDAGPSDLLAAAGYLFVSPENLAALAGMMKDFFDRCYYPVLPHLVGRPYAQIVAAGSDGEPAARQLARIATGWRLTAIADPLIVRVQARTPEEILAPKRLSPAQLETARQLGATLAAGLDLGIW